MVIDDEAGDFAMTEISDSLSGPQAIEVAALLLARLEVLKQGVDRRISDGLPMGHFSRFEAVSQSIATARSIVLQTTSRKLPQ